MQFEFAIGDKAGSISLNPVSGREGYISIHALAELQDNLGTAEGELLKESFDDLIRNTPQTTLAAQRVKLLFGKAGSRVSGLSLCD